MEEAAEQLLRLERLTEDRQQDHLQDRLDLVTTTERVQDQAVLSGLHLDQVLRLDLSDQDQALEEDRSKLKIKTYIKVDILLSTFFFAL